MIRLGILGGTFDPIHQGHIAMAERALALGAVDRVVFVPMARPAHRELEASPEERMALCRLALAGRERMALSEAGMNPGARFTADVLPLIKKEYPDAAPALLMGADKLKALPDWHAAQKIFSQCEIYCFPRDGKTEEKALEKARLAGANVTMLAGDIPPFSSSVIRAQTRAYEDAPGLDKAVLCAMACSGLYQKDLLPKLRLMMNPRRFQHTLGVRQEAVRLAALHGLPIQKASLAGLLHDCAKGMSQKDMEKIARKQHLTDDPQMLSSGAMLHGPVGACLAKKQFGVTDEDILNAIRSHTIGRPGMTGLELCIFVADATEPNREDYDGLEEIRALAEVSLEAAALRSMQWTQVFLEKTGRPFFPAVLDTMRDLEGRLPPAGRQMLGTFEALQKQTANRNEPGTIEAK